MEGKKILSLDEIGLKYFQSYESEHTQKRIYRGGDKTSKVNSFTTHYEKIFGASRDKEINILELGVLDGRSIAMWSEYFAKGKIYGVDIKLERFKRKRKSLEEMGAFENQNFELFECDITRPQFRDFAKEKFPKFDFIVDDALHQPKVQFNNFKILFGGYLKDGGIYVIEDIVKPGGFIKAFGDILAGVSNQKSQFALKNVHSENIASIRKMEMQSNLVTFFKK